MEPHILRYSLLNTESCSMGETDMKSLLVRAVSYAVPYSRWVRRALSAKFSETAILYMPWKRWKQRWPPKVGQGAMEP